MLVNDDAWLYFSEFWQTRVFGWICEGASGTYATSVFDSGRRIRHAFYADGELLENDGTPLPAERDIDWASIFEDDILSIAERIGAPFGCSEAASQKHVYLLDESHMAED
jgi:hypothetical protein